MSFNLRPGTSLFGNITFTPGTNENYVAPPIHQGPPPMTVGWSNAGLSESERVAPAANGMQLYRYDQPYTNAHPNRTLHNLPEYLEGLPFTVESAQAGPENGIEGTPHSLEEYTFNTSGTLYLILRADWGGYVQNPMGLQQLTVPTSDTSIGTGVLDPSAWTSVEDSVGYMGGGGDYGTYVFSRSVEAGTHSLNNLYYYAFKADATAPAAPEPAPAPSASWVVVSANKDDDAGNSSGSIYVYDNNDLSSQPYKLVPNDGKAYMYFASEISILDEKMYVGVRNDDDIIPDSGAVYVYDINNLGSQPLVKIKAYDAAQLDNFGSSVYITSDKLIVGAFGDDDNGSNSGSIYVYDANNLSASPTKIPSPGNANDRFGSSIVANSSKIAVGAYGTDRGGVENSGAVYVYDANDLSSTPVKLEPNTLFAEAEQYGRSSINLSISEDKLVVGAYLNDDLADRAGKVYIYDLNDLSAQPTELTAFDGHGNQRFGISTRLTGDRLLVGANGSQGFTGAVYIYDMNDLSATPTKLQPSALEVSDYFGAFIDTYGSTLVIGAHGDDDMASGSGAAYVYDLDDLSVEPTKLTPYDGAKNDHFGITVKLA